MNKYLPIILLVSIIFVAGCIRQERPPTVTRYGVIIKSFMPELTRIYSGDSVTFTLVVENVGEADAKNVTAMLFGLGKDWSGDINTSKAKQNIGELSKAQPDRKIPGGTAQIQWDVTSPSNLPVDMTYTAKVRVEYNYDTTAVGVLRVYNDTYLKTLPVSEAERIKASSGIESFNVTSAPLSISLVGATTPFIYRTVNQNASVVIQIANIGEGAPYLSAPGDLNIKILKLTVNNANCTNSVEPVQRIPKSGTKSITCQFTLPRTEHFTTIPIEIKINYNYYVDASAGITVLKAD